MMPRLATLPLVLLALLAGCGVAADTSPQDVAAYLTAHNTARAEHGAKGLGWNETLANAALWWVSKCKFQHSGGSLGPYGENLAAGTGGSYDIAAAVKSWTDEASQYNAQNPAPSHFTQVVWKNSAQVGCAEKDCPGIFPADYGMAKYHACEYFPAGNVIGQFPENVQP
ncbi:transporter [Ganoderma sinense ZZ0214-1]|uniref:Transporter n=1 Tax=Ganoderma sinense ZZ0214-1 TaxID=1077348 RepID=A0A2G8S2I9_9APHY|nr:transporter [Ganoderma sinense ZZ0214-1]